MHTRTGGRTVTRHKAHVPKIQNNDNQPFAEDDTFVTKNVGVKSNILTYLILCIWSVQYTKHKDLFRVQPAR